jgi:PAS domain S-box-containing protein
VIEREGCSTEAKHDDAEIAVLAAIVESSHDAIIGIRLDGRVESWNRGAELLYGYSREEMLGRSMAHLLPDGHVDEEASLRREVQNGHHMPAIETVRVCKSGSQIEVSLAISPIHNETGELRGFSHIARDISARVRSERAGAHLAAIIDSSDDAIISQTIDGVIQSWNAGAERLYGYAAQEVLGQPMVKLLPKSLLEEESAIWTKVRRGERVQHFDTVRIHKDGRPLEVSLTISSIHGPAGEIIGISHVGRDISATRQLRERLQVSQKMEALGRLAGGVAHDFNNLLTVINGYGALLQAAMKNDPDCEDMANEVIGAAEKAAELTRQLLVFSRHQVFHLQALDLNEQVLKVRGMLSRLIGEDVSVETRLAPCLERIRSDPGQIGQILMNLAANARDAMPGGGKIVIQTENWTVEEDRFHEQIGFTPGRYVRLLFSDTGHGMDAITRSRIFEPFFTTKEIGKGTGLGLASVYGIVKQSGGQISVYSEPECGTTFAIYLPSTEEDQPRDVTPEAEVRRGHETILLVEDEPSVRKLAYSILQANGYTVLTASNATEALSQARCHAERIKLLVTDIVMPGGNGQELASQLAAQRPDLRVIFMSGYSEHVIPERIFSEPGAAFLQKPFTPAQLLRAIRDMLD